MLKMYLLYLMKVYNDISNGEHILSLFLNGIKLYRIHRAVISTVQGTA